MTTAQAIRPQRTGKSGTIDESLLRERVTLLFGVLLVVELAFHAIGTVFKAIGFVPADTGAESNEVWAVRMAALGLLALCWVLARYVLWRRRALVTLEVLGTLMLAGSYVHLGMRLPFYGPAFGFLSMGMIISLRAALVPSPVWRTASLGTVLVATGGFAARATTDLPGPVIAWLVIVAGAVVAVSAVTSRVIYGLEREVEAARRLGQYELIRKIGEGGMGAVYEATHVMLRRPTALKLLPVEKAGAETVARFEREVQQTSRLEHPNSVFIYDYGRTPEGQFYYAMEYLDGLDLAELVAMDGPVPEGRVVHVLRSAARALAEAHRLGLVHRDIKPANIMLCDRAGVADTVKVLDFGLVKQLESGDEADLQVTQENAIVGTPHYLAPEAIQSPDGAIPASDVYALGAVAFFMLTAREVFEGKTVIELCSKHLTATPDPIAQVRGTAVDPTLERIVCECLAKDPRERPRDGAALAALLTDVEGPPWSDDEAQAWWSRHRSAGGDRRRPTVSPPTQLSVDLGARV